MKNLRYHFPTCCAYSVKEPIGELNLKRALDEDTGVFSSFFSLLSSSFHWVRQPFLGIPPFISDPGSLCLFFILIFCESLAPWYVLVNTLFDTFHCTFINAVCSVWELSLLS